MAENGLRDEGGRTSDSETVVVETDRSFWKQIAKRRNQRTISLTEIRKRLRA